MASPVSLQVLGLGPGYNKKREFYVDKICEKARCLILCSLLLDKILLSLDSYHVITLLKGTISKCFFFTKGSNEEAIG